MPASFPPHLNTKSHQPPQGLEHNHQDNGGPSRATMELVHDEELSEAPPTGVGGEGAVAAAATSTATDADATAADAAGAAGGSMTRAPALSPRR